MLLRKHFLAFGVLAFLSVPLWAQPAAIAVPSTVTDPLEIRLVRNKVILVDGKEQRTSADVAKPGDTLEEVATYTNKSKSTLRSLAATLPVPPSTELVMASVRPDNAKASLDGSRFESMPLKRIVRRQDGVETEQLVPLSEYRYLRWYPGDLPGDKTLTFSARFKVSGDANPAPPPSRN